MRAISLFSGAGGDTYGLESAGVSVVGFIEIEQDMIRTHLANFPNSVLIGRDIAKVFRHDLEPYIGNIDIMFGGFPCQSYSKGGKKDPNDPRAGLFREFVRLAEIVKPKWIIGENVKHILKMKTVDGSNVSDIIAAEFENIGYTMAQPTVLKAIQFGVPQLRERCFFVGSLEGHTHFNWTKVSRDPVNKKLIEVLEESLENAVEITPEQAVEYGIKTFIEIADEVDMIVTGSPPTNLIKCIQNNTLSFGKRISPVHSEVVDPNYYSKTLICTYNRMPRLFVAVSWQQKVYLRPFTIREAKLIQGFPENYILFGNRSSMIKQIGNAVPPQFVQKIVETIKNDAL